MADRAPYSDTEAMLVNVLADFGTTGTVTPDDLQDQLPFVKPARIGGADDGVTDVARVDVDVLAGTRAQAWDIARRLQQRLISAPIRVPGIGVIDRARTEVGPHEAPYEDETIRRVLATYRVSARRLA